MENGRPETVTASTLANEKKPPVSSVFCLKSKKRIREVEKKEDCFILEFDPYESFDISSLSKSIDEVNAAPVTVIAEKGHVACRDFPHSRDQCVVHPLSKTLPEIHCKMCYCYVCDVAAPCTAWLFHCDASRKGGYGWTILRRERAGRDIVSDCDSG